jgi:hypothetical protein
MHHQYYRDIRSLSDLSDIIFYRFSVLLVLCTEAIDLGNNLFTGSIPTEVGSISRLEYFSVNNNSFNGNLPRELALLTNLSKYMDTFTFGWSSKIDL